MYYRLLNTNTHKYDVDTYGVTSLTVIKSRLWNWFEKEEQLNLFQTNNKKKASLDSLIEFSEFMLEKSKTPFFPLLPDILQSLDSKLQKCNYHNYGK